MPDGQQNVVSTTLKNGATLSQKTTTPIVLHVVHPATVPGSTILQIVTSAVETDAPIILQAIPGTSPQVAVYAQLGVIGLEVANQIVQAIQAVHSAQQQQNVAP